MRITEKTYNRNKAYNAKAYEQIKVESRKENRLRELIEAAATKRGETSAKYIRRTLTEAVNADGITIDSLPPAEPPKTSSEAQKPPK